MHHQDQDFGRLHITQGQSHRNHRRLFLRFDFLFHLAFHHTGVHRFEFSPSTISSQVDLNPRCFGALGLSFHPTLHQIHAIAHF